MKSIKTKLQMLQAVLDLCWIYIVRKKVGIVVKFCLWQDSFLMTAKAGINVLVSFTVTFSCENDKFTNQVPNQ